MPLTSAALRVIDRDTARTPPPPVGAKRATTGPSRLTGMNAYRVVLFRFWYHTVSWYGPGPGADTQNHSPPFVGWPNPNTPCPPDAPVIGPTAVCQRHTWSRASASYEALHGGEVRTVLGDGTGGRRTGPAAAAVAAMALGLGEGVGVGE